MPSSIATQDREGPDPAELAARFGLTRTTARPTLLAYLKQLWARRHFILSYASARSTSQYSGSRLGQIWQVITPLLNAGVYFILFGVLLGTSRGVDNFTAFLVTGVFVFTFTQRSLNNGAKSISGNLQLVRALHFPRAVLPLSFVLVEFRQLMISMALLFVIIPITGIVPTKNFPDGPGDTVMWSWLLIIPAIALHMLFNLGLSLLMARVGALSADVNQLLPFITRIWFYMSGVFYSVDRFGPALGALYPVLQLNPGAIFLDLYRMVLIESHEPLDLPLGLNIWAVAATWSFILFIGGFLYFWHKEEAYGRG
ncbi:MAG: ABC transporter permease [Actinophytocola sp.]|nr:ABC transporter permease [Actinophytocola sp.]